MPKREVKHPDAPADFSTGAYSPGLIIDGWVYVSGQTPVDVVTGEWKLGTIEAETRLVLHNIRRVLEAAGASLDDVVKCTVHLSDINDFGRFNAVYAEHFPGVRPARTTVQSVLARGIKIEIDAIAKLP